MHAQGHQQGAGAASFRGPYIVSSVLAALLIFVSAIGIAGGASFYARYPVALAGLVGQDIYTLIVVVPVLALTRFLASRGSVAGVLVWIGTLFYVAYTYYFLVVGGFNAMFPAYVAIVAIALHACVALVLAIDPLSVAARFADRGHRRPVAALFLAFAGLFALLWGGMTAGAIATGETPNAVVHAVVAIDGSVLLPLLLIGGALLWRRNPRGYILGGLLLTKLAMTGFGLTFTTVLAGLWAGGLGQLDAFLLVVFALMGATGLVALIHYLRALGEAAPTAAADFGMPGRDPSSRVSA